MNTAQKVIEKFGGQSALARHLGMRQSAIAYWARTGLIPSRHHATLLGLAQEAGIDLEPKDFVPFPHTSPSTFDTSPGISAPESRLVTHRDRDFSPGTQVQLETLAEADSMDLCETRLDVRLPEARWPGQIVVGGTPIPCYVLDDGRRVLSRTGALTTLTEGKGGGNLESYLSVEALSGYIPSDLSEHMIEFTLDNVVNKSVRGISADTFLDICHGYVKALDAGALKTERQRTIATKAAMFLAACSKIGLLALIDEATGYQYVREQDALQFKLKLYLAEDMRKWEPTFPEDLWKEFGRLTNWQGSIHKRPKFWGKLVNELVYHYLDPDVAEWLVKHAPKPKHGQNYHQWLTSQYGLKKLVEHLWMLIGMASACDSLPELKEKMAEKFGHQRVTESTYLPPPAADNRRRKLRNPVLRKFGITMLIQISKNDTCQCSAAAL